MMTVVDAKTSSSGYIIMSVGLPIRQFWEGCVKKVVELQLIYGMNQSNYIIFFF